MSDLRDTLWQLTRTLGDPARDLVVIGEGNTSARVDDETFLIKASGQQMQTMEPRGLVQVRFAPILAMLESDALPTLDEQKAIARAAKVDPTAPDPSIEVSFHALLLAECGVPFIGHTHPTPIVSILCSPRAREFAERRTFPDEAVLCGPRSAYVPYTDPGLPLAHAIRRAVRAFRAEEGIWPRVILLENHGFIALGSSPQEVLNITTMAVKGARVFLSAAALGGPVFLREAEVRHIVGRPDEIYRRDQFAQSNRS